MGGSATGLLVHFHPATQKSIRLLTLPPTIAEAKFPIPCQYLSSDQLDDVVFSFIQIRNTTRFFVEK
jgi:hypothetical protein